MGTPNLSMQVNIQSTYLTLGWIFVYMVLFYPIIKVSILQLRGAVENIWKKDRLKITGGRNKKSILEKEKRVRQERGTPNYLRTVNLIAPVVPTTGGAFQSAVLHCRSSFVQILVLALT